MTLSITPFNLICFLFFVQVPHVDIASQVGHFMKVTFDVNYEDTVNVEEYVCEDHQKDKGYYAFIRLNLKFVMYMITEYQLRNKYIVILNINLQ